MLFYVCFALAAATFALLLSFSIFMSFRPYRTRRFFKTFYLLAAAVFISAFFLFLPVYIDMFRGASSSAFLTGASIGLATAHNVIRLFIVDCDFSFLLEQTAHLASWLRGGYLLFSGILFVVAPILTVGVVLSFVERLTAYNRYVFRAFKDVYIFSELNERSLALAKSLKKNDRSRLIVFTDVFEKEDESSYEIIEQAKELDAILFKQDITRVNFRFHYKKTKMYFFVLGKDEEENINQTVHLASGYTRKKWFAPKNSQEKRGYDYPRGDTRLYWFSTNFNSEQYLSAINTKYLKLRRVNDVQSLIYNLLYNDGMQIFESAKETGNTVWNSATGTEDPEKLISAVVIGMGLHGTEMIKALSWFGQMHPYRLEIHAFDKNKNADAVFQSQYPDLFDCNPIVDAERKKKTDANDVAEKSDPEKKQRKPHNGDFETPGEAHYQINVYAGTDVDSYAFDRRIKQIPNITYVFICMGDDDKNIQIATKIRVLMRRRGIRPVIHTVVYNPNKQDMLRYGRTASGDSYEIHPLGDIAATYSESCILNSHLETKALARHMEYVKKVVEQNGVVGEERERMFAREEETFWKYDYNYRSSIASAIHTVFKKKCDIPGSHKLPDDRTEDEKWFYRRMEHQRWNAYVRSEGFVWSATRDKMAKTHHLLVPFDELPYEEQIKDDN